jgi:hypothetical protein
MKESLRKLATVWLIEKYIKGISKFKKLSAKEIFTIIYETNHWKSLNSLSGTGSEISQTKSLIVDLGRLLVEMNIRSVLDIPCGDFNWMQNVDLSNINYIGADIVEDLINSNISKYGGRTNIKFKVLNLITDPLPECDIIIVRDCLVHLSYKDISLAIKNIKSSKCKYLLATTFTLYYLNYDISTGDWRRINFQEKPFSFPPPIMVINENCTSGNGKYMDKSMALWEIANIRF